MGGALAMHIGLQLMQQMAAVFALSPSLVIILPYTRWGKQKIALHQYGGLHTHYNLTLILKCVLLYRSNGINRKG